MANILFRLIDGRPVILEVESWITEDINNDKPIIISDNIEPNYSDYNKIEIWSKYGFRLDRDYKYVRNEIKKIILDIINNDFSNFGYLKPEHQEIACKLFIVPNYCREKLYKPEEQSIFGREFHKNSTESREIRACSMMSEIYNRLLKKDDCDLVVNSLLKDSGNGFSLIDLYIGFGREGIESFDKEGLFDYIMCTVGTSYENTGLFCQSYSVIGMDNCKYLAEKLIKIVRDGVY